LIYACFRVTDTPASGYPLGVKAAKAAFEAIQKSATGTSFRACENLLRAVVKLSCQDPKHKFQGGMIDTQSYEDLWTLALAHSQEPGFMNSYQQWFSSSAKKFAPMATISESNEEADNFKVFLVFDEASFLQRDQLNITVTPAELNLTHISAAFLVTAFRLLSRALWNLRDDFRTLGVVAVFIDTHSSISNFVPPASNEPSARAQKASLVSLAVYWQINAEPTMFTHLHPFLFGRPMIGGYYNAVTGNDAQSIDNSPEAIIRRKESSVIHFFKMKMAKPTVISEDWVAAIMCCLLDLEIRTESALPDKLIRSYMVFFVMCLYLLESVKF
jgi:hypothetical protein